MSVINWANWCELKYHLQASDNQMAASGDRMAVIMEDIKSDLIQVFRHYVDETAKVPILKVISDAGEPSTQKLVHQMEKIVANIDSLTESPVLLFKECDKVLNIIQGIKTDPENKAREFIHNTVRIRQQQDIKHREQLKSKFETTLRAISIALVRICKVLSAFMPGDFKKDIVPAQRAELSKSKLIMFSRTLPAQIYGLNSLDILEKVLSYPDLKEKLTTLINAIERGHIPRDGVELAAATKEIKELWRSRQSNNLEELEKE